MKLCSAKTKENKNPNNLTQAEWNNKGLSNDITR